MPKLRAVVEAAKVIDEKVAEALAAGSMVVIPPWFGHLHDALIALDYIGEDASDE